MGEYVSCMRQAVTKPCQCSALSIQYTGLQRHARICAFKLPIITKLQIPVNRVLGVCSNCEFQNTSNLSLIPCFWSILLASNAVMFISVSNYLIHAATSALQMCRFRFRLGLKG